MIALKKLILLISFSLLAACSFLQSFHSQSPEYIEILIKEKQYGKAQNILQHSRQDHPDYPALMAQKKRLQKLSRQLETETLSQIEVFLNKNKWHQALQQLNHAREILPQSQTLKTTEQKFMLARQKRINELNMKVDIHKGIWLRDAEPLLDDLVKTQPDNYERRQQQQQFQQEKSRTLKNLARCADEAMNEELFELGRRCIMLVKQIDNTHKYTVSLEPAKAKLQAHDHAWHQQQNKISTELLKELKQGYSHDNLLRASLHLQKLSRYKQTTEEIKSISLLQQELNKGIAQSMDAGRQLYSEGKVSQALSIWISLRKITADNEALEAHINRAQRVLEKLERLGKSQPLHDKTPSFPKTQ
ncbi:hypothetical protein MNBD_GAMMA25-1259 [hydrothermal vent metagenome]|uniref:Uncharacterized protein n=1 Tax=hydrothermal vent metagenome TaxID=652676 RepID=A0A3B1BCP3_9ZZZZ